MEEVIEDQPVGRQIHVILDNLSTHKKNDDWLAAHPNVTFHFTPTSASWLNQVEIWFGIFQRKTLNNASFASIEQLTKAIHDFTVAYNANAAPFVWRKREVKGAQLRNTLSTGVTGGPFPMRCASPCGRIMMSPAVRDIVRPFLLDPGITPSFEHQVIDDHVLGCLRTDTTPWRRHRAGANTRAKKTRR